MCSFLLTSRWPGFDLIAAEEAGECEPYSGQPWFLLILGCPSVVAEE